MAISRRAILQGIGGATVGLPVLDAMLDRGIARAQTAPPKRYLVCFGGQSLGGDNSGTEQNHVIPNASGAGYDLKTALQPFGTVGVQNEISVVSGLRIPTGPEAAGVDQQPPGGRPPDFHITSLSPLFSGVRQYITNITQECCDENGNPYNNVSYGSYVRGPTSDQLVGAAIGGGRPVLTYRVQKEWYLSQSAPYGRDLMSYRSNGTGGTTAVPATDSPQAAYQALFFSQPTGDQTQAAIADFTLRSRRSVLDLVRNRTAALINKLGSADRQKMQQHFDEIRDLENRLVSPPPYFRSVFVWRRRASLSKRFFNALSGT